MGLMDGLFGDDCFMEEFRKEMLELHVQNSALIHTLITVVTHCGLVSEEEFEKAAKVVEVRMRQKIDQDSARAKEEEQNKMVEQVKTILTAMGADIDDETVKKAVGGDFSLSDLIQSMERGMEKRKEGP